MRQRGGKEDEVERRKGKWGREEERRWGREEERKKKKEQIWKGTNPLEPSSASESWGRYGKKSIATIPFLGKSVPLPLLYTHVITPRTHTHTIHTYILATYILHTHITYMHTHTHNYMQHMHTHRTQRKRDTFIHVHTHCRLKLGTALRIICQSFLKMHIYESA